MSASKLNEAVDSYMNLVMKVTAAFYATCVLCASSSGTTRTTSEGAPGVDSAMMQYILTQVFPLEQVLQEEDQQSQETNGLKELYEQKMKELIQLFVPTASQASPVDNNALDKLVQTRHKLVAYLSSLSETTLEQLKMLAQSNDLFLLDLPFEPNLNKLTNIVMWVLTAFADWYGVEVVDTNDVFGCVQMLLSYEHPQDILKFYNQLEGGTDQQKELAGHLTVLMTQNNLYITEAALRKLTGLYSYVNTHPKILQSMLRVGSYMCNL